MLKSLLTVLLVSLFAPASFAAPAHANPWFAWRTLEQAEKEFGVRATRFDAEHCVFSNDFATIVFRNGRRMAEVDGVTVWLNVAPEATPVTKEWRIASIDLDLIALTMRAAPAHKPRKLKIMLDAGHGGADPGAVSDCGKVREKDINLELTLKTGKLLRKAGMDVHFTRTRDIALSLDERAAAASRGKADLFVSMHVNKASNTNACGIETFVLTPSGYPGTAANSPPRGWQIGNKNDYNSNLLGFCIQKELVDEPTVIDRGLKRQSFFVLREIYCPAALVEVGFLSNAADLGRLKCGKWRAECAAKIAEGILEYCRRVDTLNTAVAELRQQRMEADKRWRERLAAKKSPPGDASSVKLAAQPQQTAAAANSVCLKAESTEVVTKESVVDLEALLRFYEEGTLN